MGAGAMRLEKDEAALFEHEQDEYAQLLASIRAPLCCVNRTGMEITCIGNSGGGASVVRGDACGGFLLRYAGRTIIVDPGDNAMSFLVRAGLNPFEITDVLASHSHNDHVGDLSLAVSAAINLGLSEDCDSRIVVAPTLIDYQNAASTKLGFTLPAYAWRARVESLYFEEVKTARFDGKIVCSQPHTKIIPQIGIHATEARHGGTLVAGFVIETDIGQIGYTSDTQYFKELSGCFTGVDFLWMNMNTLSLDGMLTDGGHFTGDIQPVHNHLGYVGVCKLIEEVRPKTAIISHFGAQLLGQRVAIEAALRARFAPLGVTVHCPANLDSFQFDRSLADAPTQRVFRQ